MSVPYNLVPHLAHRTQIYTFPNPFIPHNWGVAGVAPDDPDLDHTPDEVEWIIVDRMSIGPESREANLLATLLDNDEFEVVSDTDGVVVARRVKPPVGDIGPDGHLIE